MTASSRIGHKRRALPSVCDRKPLHAREKGVFSCQHGGELFGEFRKKILEAVAARHRPHKIGPGARSEIFASRGNLGRVIEVAVNLGVNRLTAISPTAERVFEGRATIIDGGRVIDSQSRCLGLRRSELEHAVRL